MEIDFRGIEFVLYVFLACVVGVLLILYLFFRDQ